MSQIIPSYKLVLSKTLDLQQYIKYQKYSPPINKGVKHSISHIQKKSIRDGRSIKRSIAQRKTRIMNIGLCNLVHCKDGYLKFYTFTTKESYYDRKQFVRLFTDFIRRFNRYLGYKSIYIAVPEQHNSDKTSENKRFSYHFHAVFFNIPYIHFSVIVNLWGLGDIDQSAVDVNNGYKAISYVLKYLAKESTINERISIPRGILRPIESFNLSEPLLTPIFKNVMFIPEADITVTTALYKKL